MKIDFNKNKDYYVHIFSQFLYIAVSFFYSALSKSLLSYGLIVFGFIGGTYVLNRFELGVKKGSFPLTVLAIVNSIFIFLEGYSLAVFLLAGFAAALSRAYFTTPNLKPVFNPSAIAVLAVVSLFPENASLTTWGENWIISTTIFFLGNLSSFFAGSLLVSWSYLLGFVSLSVISFFLLTPLQQSVTPILFFPATLLSIGTLIFTFHVISDPRTRPSNPRGMILFGVSLALVDLILRRCEIIFPEFWAYLFVQGSRGTIVWLSNEKTAKDNELGPELSNNL